MIQFQQQSANSINFEMRAGSGVFGTSVFPNFGLSGFLQSPASGAFFAIFNQVCQTSIIDRIEVVRGAASALIWFQV